MLEETKVIGPGEFGIGFVKYSISNSIIGKKYTITLTSIIEIDESSHSNSLSIIAVDLPDPATLTLSKKIQIIVC